MSGHPTAKEELYQAFLYILMVKVSSYPDRQALPGVFIDHVKDPKGTPIASSVCHEIVTPDMIGILSV
jgi:hypothetical protein